ncbi:hypothetical protein AK812_SmicGene23416 [Symbiodinium microadriaticum]|uniref:Reverse transcriptase domain-containing protein n=1 Tax=Symbiodinium microadriaticum TaxID=2951 RepID=A0A1Q9DH84_SYMMI|nr:hypothetical protein AK812_SmicGene23416 [Symbiodinium microadriaticum]
MAGTESLDWIQHNTTMFADDLLLQWEYSSISELERMISAIQRCFQILARLGLQVQHRKTQLLLAQKGRLAHKWWQAHTASTKEGRFLRIPQPGQKDLHLPIVPQLTYLGIVLSYKEASQALLLRLGVEDPLPFLLRAGQLALDSHVEQVIPPRTEFCPTEKTALDEEATPLRRCYPRQTLHPKASPGRHLPPTQLHPAMEHVPEQMDLDKEEWECFGNLLGKRPLALGMESPNKYPHPSGKGVPLQGGSRQRPLPPQRGSRQTAPSQGSRTKEEHRGKSGTSSDQLLYKVAKALIVQSDYLSRLQSDHTVIFTFRNGDGPQLMVPLLHEVTANWRDQRSKGKVTKSLKQTLLQYVTSEIITRVTTFADDKNAQAKAQEMGWVTSDLEYNYLDWNAEEQRLVPRQEGTLTQVQVLADARRLKTLLKEQELIIKFSASRNAQPNSASETATFILELSLQIPAAAEAMAIFRKWFASSALLLLSLRLKPARPERSPLIKEIQEAVGW